ncbi:IS5 family transposase (plasmid) [Qipengyuania spongiae]|uniref:IS5 family transposase n=1 Tax=Qipengyuania spongiae TaxID=2909673 RepID=A0ABY5T6B9_9SPHN|nr:IS5 family transposase [Qipengyuania spongiae]UVI40863.1 IS5 family transposase [Qipengyuania spongiae]
MSDAEWVMIGPLLPPERGRRARPAGDNRRFLNGMLYVLRVGCPWRDMHERYGKWNSMDVRFRRWAEQGVWDAMLQTLVDLGLTNDWQHIIDSTSVRDHVSSAGGKGGACANALGRSRGGFTSKIHARSDNQGRPLGFLLTGGEMSDYTCAKPLMEIPIATPKRLLADKGYDGDRFRQSLLMRGISPIIPPHSNRKEPEHFNYRRYRHRNRIERMFGKLKQQRRIAARYDEIVLSFESFLNLAASRLWLKSYVNAA